MPESKHILTSKIFLSAVVGLLSTLTVSVLRSYGYDVIISPDVQLHVTTVVMALIAYWRTGETKSLHIKKPKDHFIYCPKCRTDCLSHNIKHDAKFCTACDVWIEKQCGNSTCSYCLDRPEKPSEVKDA